MICAGYPRPSVLLSPVGYVKYPAGKIATLRYSSRTFSRTLDVVAGSIVPSTGSA
jgi:hypothetical protein